MISRSTITSHFFPESHSPMAGTRRWAVLASAIWFVVAVTYAVGFLSISTGSQPRGTVFLDALFFLIALILPILLIWIAARFTEELQVQKEVVLALAELTAPLSAELSATRQALEALDPREANELQDAALAKQSRDIADLASRVARVQLSIDRLARSAREQQPASPEPQSLLPDPPPLTIEDEVPETEDDMTADAGQPDLPFSESKVSERPEWGELVRALDFPRDDQDFEGFRALQSVLKYPPLAQLLQSAEDVLTLLSQEGVYMDEIAVDEVNPEHWRKYFAGARGASIEGANLVKDPHTIEQAETLLRTDPIFRDAALFFQQRFAQALSGIVPDADDSEITDISNTRSGRAFMLLARISGAFDN